MRALAVSTPKRMPQLPDVPTVAEIVPGYDYVAWNGYAVPGGVPDEVKKRLAEALAPITREPQIVEIFQARHRRGRHHAGRGARHHPQGHPDLFADRRYRRRTAQVAMD